MLGGLISDNVVGGNVVGGAAAGPRVGSAVEGEPVGVCEHEGASFGGPVVAAVGGPEGGADVSSEGAAVVGALEFEQNKRPVLPAVPPTSLSCTYDAIV